MRPLVTFWPVLQGDKLLQCLPQLECQLNPTGKTDADVVILCPSPSGWKCLAWQNRSMQMHPVCSSFAFSNY